MNKAVHCSTWVMEAFTDRRTDTSLPPIVKAKGLQAMEISSCTTGRASGRQARSDAFPTAAETPLQPEQGRFPQTPMLKVWAATWYHHWAGVGTDKVGRSLGHWGHNLEVENRTLDSSSSFFFCFLALRWAISLHHMLLLGLTILPQTQRKSQGQPGID